MTYFVGEILGEGSYIVITTKQVSNSDNNEDTIQRLKLKYKYFNLDKEILSKELGEIVKAREEKNIEEQNKNKPRKGKELCNRTACQSNQAVYYYNKTMDAYYCNKCARLINSGAGDLGPLCVVDNDRLLKWTKRRNKC